MTAGVTPSGVTSGDRFRSWAEIQANAARAAGGLRALGVGEDDSVALMLRNDFATFEVNMAAGQLGAYAVPINWHFTPEEASYILEDCAAKVLVAHSDLLAQIAPGIPPGVAVLVVPTPEEVATAYNVPPEKRRPPEGTETWDAFMARSAPNTEPPKASRGSMIYTSGTTGQPKGAMLSHRNLIVTARNAVAREGLREADEVLAYLPMAWVGDHMFSFAQSIVAGFTTNCPESAATVLHDLREIGPTYFFAPPRIWENILTSVVIRIDDASWVKRRMVHARAPAGVALQPGQEFNGGTVVDVAPAEGGAELLAVMPV